MMCHAWPIVLRGGLLDPRGCPPRYALMIVSHRGAALRGAVPAPRAAGRDACRARSAGAGRAGALAARCGLLAARPRGARVRRGRCLIARYYVLTPGVASPPGSGTTCATAPPRAGRRRRARGEPARLRPRRGRGRARPAPSPILLAAVVADPPRVAPGTRSTASGASAATARAFDVLKLRTMVTGAEDLGAGWPSRGRPAHHPRRARCCAATSIDELPNLVNVLRGEMSIIGPRPTVPVQVAQYTERQRGRLAVKPGITGWAQVNGRTALPWSERIELDLCYVEHRSWRAGPRDPAPDRDHGRRAAAASTAATRRPGATEPARLAPRRRRQATARARGPGAPASTRPRSRRSRPSAARG